MEPDFNIFAVPPSTINYFGTRATASSCEVEHSGGRAMDGLDSSSDGQSYVHQVELLVNVCVARSSHRAQGLRGLVSLEVSRLCKCDTCVCCHGVTMAGAYISEQCVGELELPQCLFATNWLVQS